MLLLLEKQQLIVRKLNRVKQKRQQLQQQAMLEQASKAKAEVDERDLPLEKDIIELSD